MRIIIFSIISLAFWACRKDTGPCANRSDNSEQITIGDTTSMLCWNPNFFLEAKMYENVPYELDIDGDHRNDFVISFIDSDGIGAGSGSYKAVFFKSTNEESFVNFEANIDTFYTYKDTTYISGDQITAEYTTHTVCTNPGFPDVLISTEDEIRLAHIGDVISLSDVWLNCDWDNLYSSEIVQTNISSWGTWQDDTLYVVNSKKAESCYQLPLNVPTYVPLKKITCGFSRLGWIKLTLNADGNSLTINQIAIQR